MFKCFLEIPNYNVVIVYISFLTEMRNYSTMELQTMLNPSKQPKIMLE